MKCNRHPFEGGVGVCATCLRERLLALTETTAEAAAPPSPEDLPGKPSGHSPFSPSLPFPRSVSPYASWPAAAARRSSIRGGSVDQDRKLQRSSSSWLSALLNRRRRKKLSHLSSAATGREPGMSPERVRYAESPSPMRRVTSEHSHHVVELQRSSSSWLSALLRHRRCRKKSSGLSSPASGRDRRMSPESVCYAESPSWARRPRPSPMRGVTAEHNHHSGGLAGFAMCFSPLVAANPSRRRSRVAEIGFSGEISTSPSQRHRLHASAGGPSMFRGRFR